MELTWTLFNLLESTKQFMLTVLFQLTQIIDEM